MGVYTIAGFCGLNQYSNSADTADALIAPIPYEVSTSYMSGTKFGPDAIMSASEFLELYDIETDYDVSEAKKIFTLPLPPISKASMDEAMCDIEHFTKPYVDTGKFLISIGGEHSVTPPIVKSFRKKYADLSVLQFDAHTDLRNSYEGTINSHACAMRRVRELCPAVQVGIRSMCSEEAQLIKDENLAPSIFYAKDLENHEVDEIVDQLSDHVYITFDFDALDPSIMPAVGTPEPGGMLWYDVLKILKRCYEKKNVVGADFVELMPLSGSFHADFLAAALIYKTLSYKFAL